MHKLTLAAALLLLPAAAALAQPPPPPPPPPSDAPTSGPERAGALLLPAGMSREGVKNAIVSALAGRGWQVVSSDRSSVHAHLLHRKKDCNLVFQFDVSRIDILSDSYVVDSTGVRTGRIIPNDWIENLEKDIREYASHMPRR